MGRRNKGNPPMRFKDIAIGREFDFISPHAQLNSFFHRCIKVSARKYKTVDGAAMHGFDSYRVGSVNVEVYHVQND